MEMLDKLIYKFCGWVDSLTDKVEDVFTMDFTNLSKRRKSYCARSAGQLKRSSAKTRNDPNSRIRQARRRWRC